MNHTTSECTIGICRWGATFTINFVDAWVAEK